MYRLISIAILLAASLAFAQQPPAQPPEVQVASSLGSQVGVLILQVNQQAKQITDLQQQLATAQARVKELEGK